MDWSQSLIWSTLGRLFRMFNLEIMHLVKQDTQAGLLGFPIPCTFPIGFRVNRKLTILSGARYSLTQINSRN